MSSKWKTAGWYGSLDRKSIPKIVITGDEFILRHNMQESSDINVNDDDGLVHKQVDLEKIFKPATDSGEVTPSKSRKMYASSSFYGPNHPTVEQQFQLARRISSSLSDISNQKSKGQSMFVNRKKRSVKWVHEGEGKGPIPSNFPHSLNSRDYESSEKSDSKQILKLVMDPRGQVQDLQTLQKLGENIEPCLSPEVCFDLVRDLNATKGKGAALFAKRRKRSENWVVDETNVKSASPSIPETILNKPNHSTNSNNEFDINRVENVKKMNEIQQRFTKPRLRLIKSPWEAALETGCVDSAFQEVPPMFSPRGYVVAPTSGALEALKEGGRTSRTTTCSTPTRIYTPKCQDVYTPKIPRGWNTQCNLQQPSTYDEAMFQTPQYQEQSTSYQKSQNSHYKLLSYNDYLSLNNYNTVPRGWKKGSSDYYKSVKFEDGTHKKQLFYHNDQRENFTDF